MGSDVNATRLPMIGSESGPGGRFFDEFMYHIATAGSKNTISHTANSLLPKTSINIVNTLAIAFSMITLSQLRAVDTCTENSGGVLKKQLTYLALDSIVTGGSPCYIRQCDHESQSLDMLPDMPEQPSL